MRVMKIKGDMRGIGKHIDRASNGQTESPQNANSEEINNNVHWDAKGTSYTQKEWTEYTKENPLKKRVNDRIKEGYKLDRKIRKDAVKGIELLLTSDHEKMTEIFSKEELYKSWINENKQWVSGHFGKDNIVSMSLHTDETTYHLEVVVTPITEDGRLSAKSFINGKKDLAEMQSSYSEAMSQFGMQRGEKGSSARHIPPSKFKTKNYEHNRN